MVETLVTYALIIGFFALSLGLWNLWFKRLKEGQSLLPVRLQDARPIGLVDVFLTFAICFVLAEAFGKAAAGSLLTPTVEGEFSIRNFTILSLSIGASQLVGLAIVLSFFRMRYGTATSFGWYRDGIGRDIAIGIFAFFMLIPPILLLQFLLTFLVPYQHQTLDSLRESKSWLTIVSMWFAAVLVAPIVEEMFFRCVLQGWLQRLGNSEHEAMEPILKGGYFADSVEPADIDQGWDKENPDSQPVTKASLEKEASLESKVGSDENPYQASAPVAPLKRRVSKENPPPQVYFDSRLRWSPILISAGFFAMVHIGQGAAPIPLFFFAIGLGYLYRQTGSIVPCIVLHMLLNGYSMTMATLSIFLGE